MAGTQGGDVEGTVKCDVSQGKAIEVAKACFDPGYDLTETLDAGYISKADLIRGFVDHGIGVGEESVIKAGK